MLLFQKCCIALRYFVIAVCGRPHALQISAWLKMNVLTPKSRTAQPILYGSNVFALEDTTALHAFCANIGPKNCATLRELHIKAWGYTKSHKAMNHPAFTILGQAVNLERLYIDCQIHWGAPTHVAKQIFRDGHHWFEIMGIAKGRVDAAVEILDIGDKNLGARYQYSDENGRSWEKSPDEEKKKKEFQTELRRLLKA